MNTRMTGSTTSPLLQLFPSGWEIVNTSFTELGAVRKGDARYTDIRDDRVNFYFSLDAGNSKTFTVKLNASIWGVITFLEHKPMPCMTIITARNKGN